MAGLMALVSFAPPMLHGMLGRKRPALQSAVASVDIEGAGSGVRLVACAIVEGRAVPTPQQSPGMLRGLAAADLVLIVQPSGVRSGETSPALALPW